ncbi:NAD(P)H-dependent oxidoreductase [Sulfidibacter corallicola]|uniref:NAD(P)H-dependent oxidoreductase n=1 Tax=Sulfidibacter corallicola TaxID=2818388 RepID=A0A8A4TF04_SULCO|nr:NAD(P)H-dependent oxidoreductase [Sulfidibacter corallicola]QTD48120.1 NAD(P)H-dependent oxidoreductase [Sulfidibacter corallicola]
MFVTNVLSSHYPGSQTQELLNHFTAQLDRLGHEHTTYDLYQSDFNPIMHGDDFNQFFGKPLPEDVTAIHETLKKSAALTFFYPVWWNGMPAIMKGWVDRVFARGFAYDYGPEGTRGMLELEKVILVCSLGNKKEDVDPRLEDAMRLIQEVGVFNFCGVKDVSQIFLYNSSGSPEIKQACMDQLVELADAL